MGLLRLLCSFSRFKKFKIVKVQTKQNDLQNNKIKEKGSNELQVDLVTEREVTVFKGVV